MGRGQGTISDFGIFARWDAIIHARDIGGVLWFPPQHARVVRYSADGSISQAARRWRDPARSSFAISQWFTLTPSKNRKMISQDSSSHQSTATFAGTRLIRNRKSAPDPVPDSTGHIWVADRWG
jgi:hypothetical protein